MFFFCKFTSIAQVRVNNIFFCLKIDVQKLILNGQIGEAIDVTYHLFPGILERNPNLLFALKVRQFIEMVANLNNSTPSSAACAKSTDRANSSESSTSVHTNGNSASSNNKNGHSNSNEEEMGKFYFKKIRNKIDFSLCIYFISF
jgi:hypothetical protein